LEKSQSAKKGGYEIEKASAHAQSCRETLGEKSWAALSEFGR